MAPAFLLGILATAAAIGCRPLSAAEPVDGGIVATLPARALRARVVERNWVTLQWEPSGVEAAVLQIERRTAAGLFTVLGTSIPGGTVFHDRVPVPGAEYTYRVRSAGETAADGAAAEATVFCPVPPAGTLVAWGRADSGPADAVPEGNDYVEVSSGTYHAMARRANDTVAVWGMDSEGQVGALPGAARFAQISAGGFHSLALRADGSIAAWGFDFYGQVSGAPRGRGFVKVSGGGYHSMALRADGTLVSWGDGGYGQMMTPAGTFLDADCGDIGSAAVRADGSVIYWGHPGRDRQRTPSGNDFVRVGCGQASVIGVRSDGSFDVWGSDQFVSLWTGCISEAPQPAGQRCIQEEFGTGIAIRHDGSLESWGRTDNDIVAGTPTGSGFIAVAIGDHLAVAIRVPLSRPPGDFWNGDFESGDLPPGTVILSNGLDRGHLRPWRASGARSAVITTGQFSGLQAASGRTWVEFNADDAPVGGSLFQSFLTTVGHRYSVGYVAGRSGRGPNVAGLRVEILPDRGPPLAEAIQRIQISGWAEPATIRFVATTPVTTLRFTDVSSDSYASNLALDAVTVRSAAPEDPPDKSRRE